MLLKEWRKQLNGGSNSLGRNLRDDANCFGSRLLRAEYLNPLESRPVKKSGRPERRPAKGSVNCNQLRRRRVSRAAAPKPANAMVVGSGTTWTLVNASAELPVTASPLRENPA